MAADGDPDPTSAGTAGEAALWGGSSAVVGMAANPFGAHQVGTHTADRLAGRYVSGHERVGRAGDGPSRHARGAKIIRFSSVIRPEAGSSKPAKDRKVVVFPQPDGLTACELASRYMNADVADAAAARTRRIDLHQICYVRHFSRSDRSFSRLAIDICEPGLGRRH
jgi:hypothetical protein